MHFEDLTPYAYAGDIVAGTSNVVSWEIWVPGDATLYVAPNWVAHYVAHHGYRPPDGFIDAVDRLALTTWNPAEILHRLDLVRRA